MGNCLESVQLALAVCKIGIYSIFRRICCGGSHVPRPTLELICIGLDDSGKSTLLSALAGEEISELTPTTGFLIKCVMFKDCILNIKEIGGGEKVRGFWKHYYSGTEAVVFVVNAASSEGQLQLSQQALIGATENDMLKGLPFLLIVNCTDHPGAKSIDEVKSEMDLDILLDDRKWFFCHGSGLRGNLSDIREGFHQLNALLLNPMDEEEPIALRTSTQTPTQTPTESNKI